MREQTEVKEDANETPSYSSVTIEESRLNVFQAEKNEEDPHKDKKTNNSKRKEK